MCFYVRLEQVISALEKKSHRPMKSEISRDYWRRANYHGGHQVLTEAKLQAKI
jgi:hypothetical protein